MTPLGDAFRIQCARALRSKGLEYRSRLDNTLSSGDRWLSDKLERCLSAIHSTAYTAGHYEVNHLPREQVRTPDNGHQDTFQGVDDLFVEYSMYRSNIDLTLCFGVI